MSSTTAGCVARLGVACAVLAALTAAVSSQRFLTGEVTVLQELNGWPTVAGWPLEVAMLFGTLSIALAVVVVVAVCQRDPWPTALSGLLACVAALQIDNWMKEVVERPRPRGLVADLVVRESIGGYGYPSGHTTMAFAVAASLHPSLNRWGRIVVWSLAVLTGVARMHVGVHWPGDVLGGAALGIAVGSAAALAARAMLPSSEGSAAAG